jgi:glycosyltransferase involved in cell wall biosynthesis
LRSLPLISVVMPVYNRARYVAEAVNSILAQIYPKFELIIVDDGSTDGSPEIVRALAARDRRIRLLFQPHYSQGRARNAGIALACGEYIAHMDDDDIALPDRLTTQLDWMRRTGVDICGGCSQAFGDAHGLLWFPETHEAIRNELVFRCGFLQGTVLIRADIVKAHPYDEQASFEDYEMWTRLAPLYRMGNMPRILLRERFHPQQIHKVKEGALHADWRKYCERYLRALFPNTTPAERAIIARAAGQEPFTGLGELEEAGRWLVRLAQTPDAFLRRRMADRWFAVCRRSAPLGLACHRIYRRITPQFGITADHGTFKLWLACCLRLNPALSRAGCMQKQNYTSAGFQARLTGES